MATVTINLKVSGGKFENDTIILDAEDTLEFDQSDASNAGYPVAIALYPDGNHAENGAEYTVGVSRTGTAGSSGAKTTFVLEDPLSMHGIYFFYALNNPGMGGQIIFGPRAILDPGVRLVVQGIDFSQRIAKSVYKYQESLDEWELIRDYSFESNRNPTKLDGVPVETAIYKIVYTPVGLEVALGDNERILNIDESWGTSVSFTEEGYDNRIDNMWSSLGISDPMWFERTLQPGYRFSSELGFRADVDSIEFALEGHPLRPELQWMNASEFGYLLEVRDVDGVDVLFVKLAFGMTHGNPTTVTLEKDTGTFTVDNCQCAADRSGTEIDGALGAEIRFYPVRSNKNGSYEVIEFAQNNPNYNAGEDFALKKVMQEILKIKENQDAGITYQYYDSWSTWTTINGSRVDYKHPGDFLITAREVQQKKHFPVPKLFAGRMKIYPQRCSGLPSSDTSRYGATSDFNNPTVYKTYNDIANGEGSYDDNESSISSSSLSGWSIYGGAKIHFNNLCLGYHERVLCVMDVGYTQPQRSASRRNNHRFHLMVPPSVRNIRILSAGAGGRGGGFHNGGYCQYAYVGGPGGAILTDWTSTSPRTDHTSSELANQYCGATISGIVGAGGGGGGYWTVGTSPSTHTLIYSSFLGIRKGSLSSSDWQEHRDKLYFGEGGIFDLKSLEFKISTATVGGGAAVNAHGSAGSGGSTHDGYYHMWRLSHDSNDKFTGTKSGSTFFGCDGWSCSGYYAYTWLYCGNKGMTAFGTPAKYPFSRTYKIHFRATRYTNYESFKTLGAEDQAEELMINESSYIETVSSDQSNSIAFSHDNNRFFNSRGMSYGFVQFLPA